MRSSRSLPGSGPSRRWDSAACLTSLPVGRAIDPDPPSVKARASRHGLKELFIKIADSQLFEEFMTLVILVNVGFLAGQVYAEPAAWTQARDLAAAVGRQQRTELAAPAFCFLQASSIAEYVFTVIFVVEMWIKMTAGGVRLYFKNSWNRLDFTIVVASLVNVAVDIAAAVAGTNGAVSVIRQAIAGVPDARRHPPEPCPHANASRAPCRTGPSRTSCVCSVY